MHIGIELDGTRVTAVAVDGEGRVQARADADAVPDLAAAARALFRDVRGSSAATSVGVAATVPGDAGVTDALAALRAEGAAIGPTAIASGVAAALAESWSGAAKGARDVVYFAAGGRTLGGVVRGGAPLLGAHGRATAIAWLALNPVEREDYRKTGCLEAEVAAAGIVRRLIWRIKAGDRSRVQEAVNGDLSAITADHALDAARNGDGVSISVVRDTAKYLGMAAANLVVIVDPEMLVLGGIMASSADLMMEPIRTEITRRLPKPMMDALRIETAVLGADAACIGAAHLVAAALP